MTRNTRNRFLSLLLMQFLWVGVGPALAQGDGCDDELAELVRTVQSRPWIGLEFHYLELEPNVNRFLISRVQQEGPASRAGLQQGDFILTIDKTKISGIAVHAEGKAAYQKAFGAMKVGEPLHLEVEREGKVFETDLVPAIAEGYALAEVIGQRLLMQRLGMVIATDHRKAHPGNQAHSHPDR